MWKRFLLLFFVFGLSASCFGASANWNASIVDAEHGAPDGYRIYYGSASDQLTTQYDVGAALQFGIPDEWPVGDYYFGVKAYNSAGESDWATTGTGATWVSYTKSDPPPIEPPAPATDVRVEWVEDRPMADFISYEQITSTSQSITVPTGCNLAVFVYSSWDSSYPTTSINSVNFSDGITYSNSPRLHLQYLSNPAIGSQTFSTNFESNLGAFIIYLSGIDTGSPVVSTGYENYYTGSPITDLSFSTGDILIGGVHVHYASSITVEQDGQTEICGVTGRFSVAYEISSGEFSWSYTGGIGDGGAIAIVFKASTGGASAVPKIMLLQDHFSGGIH